MHATTRLINFAGCLVMLVTPALQAAWQVIDDFEGMAYGALNGKNGWVASGKVAVQSDGTANAVAAYRNSGPVGTYERLYKSGTLVNNATTGTIFFMVYATGDILRHYVGMTDKGSPANDGALAALVRLDKGGEPAGKFEFRVSDGGGFDGYRQLNTATWYSVWMVLRNGTASATERYDVYLTSGFSPALPGDLVLANATFPFVCGNLSNFCGLAESRSPYTSVTNVWLDYIYLDKSGVNLTHPVPEPCRLLVLGGLATVLGLARAYYGWR